MAWNDDWDSVKHPVTPDMVNDVGELLAKWIKAGNGECYAKIGADVLKHFGLQDAWREWYGTYWAAVREACKRNGIGYKKCGRKGGKYFYLEQGRIVEAESIDIDSIMIQANKIKQIKTLIKNIDADTLTLDESDSILEIIEKIIS